MNTSLLYLLISSFTYCESARILATIFTPSYSHQVAFRPIWKELSKRGHEILLVTTDPMQDPELKNIKEIDLKQSYEVMEQHGASELVTNSQNKSYKERFENYLIALSKTADWQLSHPGVQNLIRNKSEYFDLIMVEMMFPTHLAFVDRFKAPFIGVFSLDAVPRVHRAIGNFMHPIVYPDYAFPFRKNLTFLQRLITIIGTDILDVYSYFIYAREDEVIRKHFGDGIRPVNEIEKDVSFIFINVNPIFHQIRPVGPTTIQIGGGAHLDKPQPLPEDLEEFVTSANDGVIYFSLGTNVKSSLLHDELKNVILDTFSELPYKILWKFEDEDLLGKPENVKIMKWVPQQDLLQHPNVILFITQCGLQSIEEAIYSHVPMVGMPFFGDQTSNSKIIQEQGMGIEVDRKNLTKEAFRSAIIEVITNPIYKERVKEVAELSKDVEMTGLEKAIWWTEYAIRTKGAKHFRNPIIDLPFYKLYLLDVIGFVLLVITVHLYLTVKTTKFVLRLIRSKKAVVGKKKNE